MPPKRQPFRQIRLNNPDLTKLQDSVTEWINRQWAVEPAPLGAPTTIKNADYQATAGETVLCNPPAAGMTISLPPITSSRLGAVVVVKEVASSWNPITVRAGDADTTIDGQDSITSTVSYAARRFEALTPTLWGEV